MDVFYVNLHTDIAFSNGSRPAICVWMHVNVRECIFVYFLSNATAVTNDFSFKCYI